MMPDYQRQDSDDNFPYRRPTISAWVAAVAIALSIFMVGGFIKLQRQTESQIAELRREIGELHETTNRLRMSVQETAGHPEPARRVTPLPVVEYPPLPASARTAPAPARTTNSLRPDPAAVAVRPLADLLEGDERPGVTVEYGRKSAPDFYNSEPSQVISVSDSQRTVLVEGGKNIGRVEGMRLEILRNGRWIVDARVITVYDSQAVCEIVHAIVPPGPGDRVRPTNRQ